MRAAILNVPGARVAAPTGNGVGTRSLNSGPATS